MYARICPHKFHFCQDSDCQIKPGTREELEIKATNEIEETEKGLSCLQYISQTDGWT